MIKDPYQTTNFKDVQIKPAQSFQHFYEACRLVHDQYYGAGLCDFHTSQLRVYVRDLLPDATTFVALFQNQVIATVTGVCWSPAKLPSSGIFPDEINKMIRGNYVIAEGTKFASRAHEFGFPRRKGELSVISEELLKTLFYWCSLVGAHEWINVVHPNQLSYFTEKLGFSVLSNVVDCNHVSDAPGVLISLNVKNALKENANSPLYLRQRYISHTPGLSTFQHHYHIRTEELLFLLLEYPQLLNECSEEEKFLINFYHPNLLHDVKPIAEKSLTGSNLVPDLLASVHSLLRFDSQPQLNNSLTKFNLYDHLKRIELILKAYAKRLDKKIIFKTHSDLPAIVHGDGELLGYMLTSALKQVLHCNNQQKLIEVEIKSIKKSGHNLIVQLKWEADTYLPNIMNTLNALNPGKALCHVVHRNRYFYTIAANFELITDEVIFIQPEYNQVVNNSTKSILIVEDNNLDQQVLERIVLSRGFNVITAANGIEALSVCNTAELDLILFNIRLPHIDGFNFANLVRDLDNSNSSIPLIACTAFVMPNARSICFEHGINDYLEKPFSITQLYSILDQHLSKVDADQQLAVAA